MFIHNLQKYYIGVTVSNNTTPSTTPVDSSGKVSKKGY